MSRGDIVVVRSPPLDRRQPLLPSTSNSSNHSNSCCLAEAAGVTTAGCAAICCCLPIGVVTILFLAVYKVPAKLCKRVIRMKRRRRLLKRGALALHDPKRCECGFDEVHTMSCGGMGQALYATVPVEMEDNDVMELEKEMWDRFYGTGFWRSLSQREG